MIVKLGSNKGEKKYNSSSQLTYPYIKLLGSIVNTPGKDSSKVDGKSDTIKVQTYLIKSSSKLFYFSIRVIYNRVNWAQKQYLVLKSFIPGISSLIGPKRNYDFFSEKIVN